MYLLWKKGYLFSPYWYSHPFSNYENRITWLHILDLNFIMKTQCHKLILLLSKTKICFRISNINTKDRIGRFCLNYSFCFEVLGQLRDDSRTSGKHLWIHLNEMSKLVSQEKLILQIREFLRYSHCSASTYIVFWQ